MATRTAAASGSGDFWKLVGLVLAGASVYHAFASKRPTVGHVALALVGLYSALQ